MWKDLTAFGELAVHVRPVPSPKQAHMAPAGMSEEVAEAMTTSVRNTRHAAEWLHGNGAMTWRRIYPGRLDQVARARSWSTMLFADTGRADDAALITTELVSNAVLHSSSGEPGGWFGVEISRRRQARIAVHDLGGRPAPQMATAAPQNQYGQEGPPAEHGHGLQIVRTLAAQVGVSGTPDSGHTVWALLTLPPSSAVPFALPNDVTVRR